MTEETSQVAAINRLAELSNTMISIMLQDIKDIKRGQENLSNLVSELSHVSHKLSQLISELSAKADKLEKHFPGQTANALIAPLLDMQQKSDLRKKERTNSRLYTTD